jgi:hypothetical protein
MRLQPQPLPSWAELRLRFIRAHSCRITAALLALGVSMAAPAQSVFDNKDMAHAKRGMEIAQKSDRAYDLVASLTTEVGRRPAGSENDAKPVAWAIAKLNSMGFDRVWKDPIKVDAWKRIGAHADLVAPYHQHLALAALGNSISTPSEGITAEVEYYETFEALKADKPKSGSYPAAVSWADGSQGGSGRVILATTYSRNVFHRSVKGNCSAISLT